MALALQAIVSLDKTGFASGLSGLSQAVSNVTGAMSMAFGGVASEIIAMSRAFGPVGGAVAALKNVSTAGMEIEQSLAEVASLTNEGAAAIGKFGQLADTVTKSTKFGMTDVVQAMNMFAAAGYESADVMQSVLKPGLDLAAAGGTSTANAVSVMVSALKTFGLEASQATNVANLFAGGANVSMASVESLGEGMVYAGSVASAYGMKLNETIGVLSLYADKGMQGSVAGTAFAQSMAALTKAANEGKTAIGEALKGWNPAVEGMEGAIKRLETSGISATTVLAEFGRQGGKAVASLLNSGSEAIANYTAKVGEVGDAADVAAQRQDTLKGSLADLKGEFERLQFELYGVVKDGLTGFIQSTVEATQWVINLLQAMKGGDWSTVKAMFVGVFDSALASAKAAFDGIREGAGKIADAFKGIDWGKTWETLKTTAESAWKSVETSAITAMAKIGAYLKAQDWGAVWDSVKQGAITAFNFWYGYVAEVWGKIAAYLKGINGADLFEAIKSGAVKVWTEIESISKAVWPTIQKYAENAFAAISEAGRMAFEAVKQAWNTVDWSKVLDDIKAGFNSAIVDLQGSFLGIRGYLTDALDSAYQVALGWWSDLNDLIRDVEWGELASSAFVAMADVADYIVSAFESLVSSGVIKDVFYRIGETIGVVLKAAFDGIGAWFGSAFYDLESGNWKERSTSFFRSVFIGGLEAITSLFIGLLSGLFGKNVVDNVVVGAQLMMLDIKLAIQSKIGDILEVFNQLMAGIITTTSGGAAAVAEAFGLKGTADEIRAKSAEFSASFSSGTNVMIRAASETRAEIKLLEDYITNLNYPVQAVTIAMADMTDAENEQVIATQKAQDATDAQVNAMEAMRGAVEAYTPALADMTDAENERMVAAQEAQDASDSAVNAMEAMAMKATKSVEPIKAMANAFSASAKDIRSINVGIKIELPKITQTMLKVWATFLNAIKGLGEIKVAIGVDLPVITERMLAAWGTFLKAIAAVKAEVKLSIELPKITENALNSWTKFIDKIKGMSADVKVNVSLPTMNDAIAESWGKFFDIFKEGSLDLKIPNASGATGGTGGTDMASIAASLKELVAMKGVIWA